MKLRTKLILIGLLTVLAGVLAHPREDVVLKFLGFKNAKLQVKQGLDLQGGAHLVYQADLSKIKAEDRSKAMASLVSNLQKRVNPTGTKETVVVAAGSDKVIIELPGEDDIENAIGLLGKKADLKFLEQSATDPNAITDTGISGNDVDRADPDFDPTTSQPIVRLRFKAGESTKKFAGLTTRISQAGSRLSTYLDQDIIFGPATVQNPITDGVAQLTGNFTVADAKQIAQLINAGALPVPISLVQQRTVGPTLGHESIARSVVAGLIGLGIVAMFMLIYYRLAGVVAVGALIIYTLLTLGMYKLSVFTPFSITLTLAGIAGFILSIGMAVDANILIFERMKEELRHGKSFTASVEAGFDRAWSSIKDSNASTLISCFILYFFSGNSPLIKGFAVTLGLGVLVSMFTAVVVSRTLLRWIISTKQGSKPSLYGLKEVMPS